MEKQSIKERIEQKTAEIEKFLAFLSEELPENLEEYKKDEKRKAACERFAEKVIQALVDLSFLLFRYHQKAFEKDDSEIFSSLQKEKIIEESLAIRLRSARGMRNFLAHEYEDINDEIIFEALQDGLERDATEFIKIVKKSLSEAKVAK